MTRETLGQSFTLAWTDVDPKLLPTDAQEPGSPAFRDAVTEFLAGQFRSLGKTRVVFDDRARTLKVTWEPNGSPRDLHSATLQLLKEGDYTRAVPLLRALVQQNPADPVPAFNLGMVFSDLGKLAEAAALLEGSLKLRPDHVPTMVALGVVHARNGDAGKAVAVLQEAARRDPTNALVHQNLGGCLLKQGQTDAALHHLRRCLELDPGNIQAKLGLAQTLETQGDFSEADGLYQETLAEAPESTLASIAKEGRTRISHAILREGGRERPDVVMYCLGALERFDSMEPKEIQALGQEIAILGMKGLDINDPERKYRLRALPGEFSGLHLVSLMYAAFQQIAPGTDVGIDLSAEYAAAKELFREQRDGG